jgi:hypothetical protein
MPLNLLFGGLYAVSAFLTWRLIFSPAVLAVPADVRPAAAA